jgi:hypothetical protein
MDDRFDRRELLLHLGEILEAAHFLVTMGRPDAAVVQLVPGCDSLDDFEFPRTLAPTMTVAEFNERVVSGVAL